MARLRLNLRCSLEDCLDRSSRRRIDFGLALQQKRCIDNGTTVGVQWSGQLESRGEDFFAFPDSELDGANLFDLLAAGPTVGNR